MHPKIVRHFKQHDPRIYSSIAKIAPIDDVQKAPPRTYFMRLTKEIVYQQLSDKAGHAIYKRFVGLFPRRAITPQRVLNTPHETLRSSGVSNAKAQYVKNVADAFDKKTLPYHNFLHMTDEEVIAALTTIKGIGRWTAEMFLMFTLGREDIFSFGDLGLKNGMKKIYGFKKEPSKARVEKIISPWSPYKTYGCLVLWGIGDV